MAAKEDFTQDEWTKLLMSPTIAGMAVTAADPSGVWGMLKEAFASGSAIAAVKNDPHADALQKAVVEDFDNADMLGEIREALKTQFAGAKPEEIIPRALAELKEVSDILDAKARYDAHDFKLWLQQVSQSVAEAASEGGFLGFGGVKVSDAEKATLADISKTLGIKT